MVTILSPDTQRTLGVGHDALSSEERSKDSNRICDEMQEIFRNILRKHMVISEI